MSADDLEAWIAERAAAREARQDRRRAWLEQANAEHREARTQGLRQRHASKLARNRNTQASTQDERGTR